jgi:hypothetical protein
MFLLHKVMFRSCMAPGIHERGKMMIHVSSEQGVVELSMNKW